MEYYCYLTLLLATVYFAFSHYRILDSASRILAIYMAVSVVTEFVAYLSAIYAHNNMPVYAIYSIVEFSLICIYFNISIDVFNKYHIGYIIAGIGIILGIANMLFLQKMITLNSYFLNFEGICIIGMALFSFFRLLLKHDRLRLERYHHFWFATIFAFYWSITFLNWSLYDYFTVHYSDKMWIINASILAVGYLTYIAICAVFILYPKMQKNHE